MGMTSRAWPRRLAKYAASAQLLQGAPLPAGWAHRHFAALETLGRGGAWAPGPRCVQFTYRNLEGVPERPDCSDALAEVRARAMASLTGNRASDPLN